MRFNRLTEINYTMLQARSKAKLGVHYGCYRIAQYLRSATMPARLRVGMRFFITETSLKNIKLLE